MKNKRSLCNRCAVISAFDDLDLGPSEVISSGDLGPSEVISPGDLGPSEVISPGDLGPCPVPDFPLLIAGLGQVHRLSTWVQVH